MEQMEQMEQMEEGSDPEPEDEEERRVDAAALAAEVAEPEKDHFFWSEHAKHTQRETHRAKLHGARTAMHVASTHRNDAHNNTYVRTTTQVQLRKYNYMGVTSGQVVVVAAAAAPSARGHGRRWHLGHDEGQAGGSFHRRSQRLGLHLALGGLRAVATTHCNMP